MYRCIQHFCSVCDGYDSTSVGIHNSFVLQFDEGSTFFVLICFGCFPPPVPSFVFALVILLACVATDCVLTWQIARTPRQVAEG